jgi:DNA-binding NtrC family response regulator
MDTDAQVALYDGDMGRCKRMLEQCVHVSTADRVPARSWYDLAHQLTRCAYYERLGDPDRVIAIADEVDRELHRRQYKALRASLLCAKARALARRRQHAAAQSCLTQAVRACPRGAVDPLILLEASKGVCEALGGDAGAAIRHFDRALAACRAIGHRYHERWIERTREALTPAPRQRPAPALDTTEAALLLTDVATILGAGHSVDLMAMRTVSLLENTPLAPRVHVESASGCEYQANPTATTDSPADGSFSLRLRGSDRQIAIHVNGAQTLEEMSLLKSIADITQIAVMRTVDTEHEDEEQNLWPRATADTDDDAVFRSPRMIELKKIAIRLAETDMPVFITGETGTGKEIFARLIHEHSKHRRGPFVPFNCSAVPRDLMESQLFGHRRGAFTGAADSFPGVIRAAERGTLFLDEIGDLDLASQPKLLRFLESSEVHAIGDLRAQRVPVRVVAATNTSIDEAMRTGQFRRDLFYRLGVGQIALPPLRERKDEIPALVSMFVNRSSRECGRSNLTIGDDFVAALLLYDWPGNIRELVNEIRRVVAMASDGDALSAAMLSPTIAGGWNARPVQAGSPAGHGFYVRIDQPLSHAIDLVEQHFIEHALRRTGGRVSDAANLLGISRKGLFLKRRRRGLVTAAGAEAL